MEKFAGRLIHPQHWPDDLDCSGKEITVIGSGATAITLVPSLARAGAKVNMLQRSRAISTRSPESTRLSM